MQTSALFLPYVVEDGITSLEDVLYKNSIDCASCTDGSRINSIGYYQQALEALVSLKRCEVRPMRDLMLPVPEGKIVVGLRHDVDHDIVTAQSMSGLEQQFGLCGSYYLLHSHPFVTPGYYAQYDVKRQCFLRNACLAPVYRALQDNGSEVGLHVDAVRLYEQGIQGMDAIQAELAWLRSQGLHITGIAAHNSVSYDRVENFEFFQEYAMHHRETLDFPQGEVILGQLSARQLGIQYEANYAGATNASAEEIAQFLEQAHCEDVTQHLYHYLYQNKYCHWGADMTCWLYGRDCWAVAGNNIWQGKARLQDVLQCLHDVPTGSRIVWHIHPFYVGLRNAEYRHV